MILEKLGQLGLTTYEAKSYLALMEKIELKAAEVAKIGGVPRSKIYEVMDKMLQKGLCHSIPGPVAKFKGVDPSILSNLVESKLERLREEIKEREKEIAETEKLRDEAIAILSEIYSQGQTNNDSFEYAETIKDLSQIYTIIRKFGSEAKKEILAFTILPHTAPTTIRDEFSNAEIDAIKNRGILCKNIYEVPEDHENLAELLTELRESQKNGEQVRIARSLPVKLFIIDEQTVMYSLEDPIRHKVSLTFNLIRHRNLALVFKKAFNAAWDEAIEFPEWEARLKKEGKIK